MEEKSFIAKLLEKKALLLLLGGILILPIIFFASNSKTGLFSRASTSNENGSQALSIDPQTGEYYDLLIEAYPFKPIIENNIANKATVSFQIYGARVAARQTLYGGIQKLQTTQNIEYEKTFNFRTEGTGASRRFVSDELTLSDNQSYGCIDLHADPSRAKENYVGTFCTKLYFFSPSSTPGSRVYSFDGREFFEVTYSGTKPAGIITLTTAYNKYTNASPPQYTANFKGSRVNYFSQDDNSSTRDFKDLTYHIQGVTQGLSSSGYNDLCNLGTQYSEKYLRYGSSLWYEGGTLIKLTERSTGGCSFEIKQPTLLRGWMNLWTRNMFNQQATVTPSPMTTKTNTQLCVPSLISPINNATVNSLEPSLTWKGCGSTSPLYYQVFVTGPEVGWTSPSQTSTSIILRGLRFQPGKTYSWYAKSCSNSSCSIQGSWSVYQSFKISDTIIAPTIATAPYCRIISRSKLPQYANNVIKVKAQGGPGPMWRLTTTQPFKEITSGYISKGQIDFTTPLEDGFRYSLEIQTGSNGWYNSSQCSFSYGTVASPIPNPTSTITTQAPIATNTPPVTQKKWTFNLVAQCPTGQKLKSTYKPGWYWWDNVDGSDADVSNQAVVTGLSNRTFYLSIFDNGGIIKPKYAPADMKSTSSYIYWNGSYNTGVMNVYFDARASACSQ